MNYKKLTAITVMFGAISLGFYSKESAAVENKIEQVSFYGMLIPGTLADAKKSGFTQCVAGYYAYSCEAASLPIIAGMKPQKVKIEINGNDNFSNNSYLPSSTGDVRNLPPEKLSYREIVLEFPEDTYKPDCLDKVFHQSWEQPIECIDKKGINYFVHSLEHEGWVKVNQRRVTKLLSKDYQVEIYVYSRPAYVSISAGERSKIIAEINSALEIKKQEESKQKKSQDIINSMKN